MLPQEVEMLPENDLIVFRRGMYATYGKKVRYFAEKKLVARTKIPAPEMPTIRIDPDVANNSLRVIAAAESDGDQASTVSSVSSARSACQNSATATTPQRRLNRAAIDAAKAVPASQRARRLFEPTHIAGKVHACLTTGRRDK